MKKIIFLGVLAIVMMGVALTSCDSTNTLKLHSDIDSVSYFIGASEGFQMKRNVEQTPDPPINLDALIDGFASVANGDSIFLGMELQEAQMFLNNFFQGYQMRIAETNKAEADKFLAENKGKSGVITTESGLQYQVITEGTGPKPKLEDVVKVHYHLTLLDGTVFQSTLQSGDTVEFPVGGVIPGWIVALQLMPVGSKYMLWIPIELGYFHDPSSPLYGKLLIFEVELLEIVKN